MICATCAKRRMRNRHYECAVLITLENKKQELPLWGPECSAYTNDPDWEKKAKEAVKEYKRSGGGYK